MAETGNVGPLATRIPPVRFAVEEFPFTVELAIVAATLAKTLTPPPLWFATLPETVESTTRYTNVSAGAWRSGVSAEILSPPP